MSAKVVSLPLYAQYFPNSPGKEVDKNSSAKKWTVFNSEEKDFTTPLSTHQIDFSIQDTTWVDRAALMASIILKTAIFSYLFYSFAGPTIHRLIPHFLQGRIVQLLPSDRIVEIVSKYVGNVSNTILTETAKGTGVLALKIFLSIWALHATLRYIIQRLVMLPLYPAQSRIVKLLLAPIVRTSALNDYRREVANALNQQGFIVRDVALEKNGVRYSGLLIGHQDTINNGQWALQATGNLEPIEHSAEVFAQTYKEFNFNTLLINGPAVGRSEGQATPESMGDAQEIGLRFIEETLKASKVVIAGRSLGGAAIGQAILKHDFKKDVRYLVVRQMTFDRASNICGKTIGQISPRLDRLVAKLVRWAGCEMDSVAAAQKLQKLGIQEVIVQASCKEIVTGELPTIDDFHTDGPIHARASLGYTLIHEKVTDNKVFRCLEYASHMTHDAVTAAKPEILGL